MEAEETDSDADEGDANQGQVSALAAGSVHKQATQQQLLTATHAAAAAAKAASTKLMALLADSSSADGQQMAAAAATAMAATGGAHSRMSAKSGRSRRCVSLCSMALWQVAAASELHCLVCELLYWLNKIGACLPD